MPIDSRTLARGHGAYNVLTGLWPLIHMPSFEAISGPKVDRWLVRTVGGMLATIGFVQLRAGQRGQGALDLARELGLGTALTFAAVDLRYGIPGRIRRIYVADALVEGAWIMGWIRNNHPKGSLKGVPHSAEA